MVNGMSLYRVIEIENLEPLKIGAAGSKQNQVEPSKDYVPGSTLRGALIHTFIQRGIFESYKRKILLNMECLNAYPFYQQQLYIPTPLHLRIDKHEWRKAKATNKPRVKLTNLLHPDNNNGKNHLEYRYITVDGDDLFGYKVPKIYRLHHSTIPNADKEERDNLFRYQAISENQIFRGIIRYPEELRFCFDEVFRNPIEAYLGGSKGSGYGRSVLKAVGEATTDFREAKNLAGLQLKRDAGKDHRLTIICLSDCVCRDEYGRPINHLPEAELSEWLQQPVQLDKQWVENTLTEGYNSTWKRRYPKEAALRAGSVLTYKLKDPLNELEIDQLEERLIGMRTQDGFGWIGVNLNFPDELAVRQKEATPPDRSTVNIMKMDDVQAQLNSDQHRVLSIMLSGLGGNKEPWLIMKARRRMDDGSVVVDERLRRSHLYNMIDGLEPVLFKLRNNQQPDLIRRPVYRDYLMDADLCSICGVHYRNIMDGLVNLRLSECLYEFAKKHINHGKGELFYLNYTYKEELFIAELLHTCLSVKARRKSE